MTESPGTPEEPSSVFLTAEWRNLAMLNYAVPPEILEPYVPAGTQLEPFRGKHYISLVGFQFLDARVLGLPIPYHRHFEEINLRFYVCRQEGDERRRGVVFIKEIVPRRAISWVANSVYRENYSTHRMSNRIDLDNGLVGYGWQHKQQNNRFSLATEGEAFLPNFGSSAEFITEHYWGYSRISDSATRAYRVEHPQWTTWNSTLHTFDIDVESTYGSEFVPYLNDHPASAFVAEGSPVAVRMARTLSL